MRVKSHDETIIKFGERMLKAREMSGLSQIEASEKLGFQHSSALAKIELSYLKTIDPDLAIRASELYAVSLDYLFGLSDFWSRDLPTVHKKQAEILIEHATKSQYEAIKTLFKKLIDLSRHISETNARISEIKRALDLFISRNPDFDDLPCGAMLARTVYQAKADSKRLDERLAAYNQ